MNTNIKICLSFLFFGFGLVGLKFKGEVLFWIFYLFVLFNGYKLGFNSWLENQKRNPPLANNGINYLHFIIMLIGGAISWFLSPLIAKTLNSWF